MSVEASETLTIKSPDGGYHLEVAPVLGGAITRFDWRDEPLFRASVGPAILDQACFPLVPFSNRIAFGKFDFGGRLVRLRANFPGTDHPHTLHGFGWQKPWSIANATPDSCRLILNYADGDWPWHCRTEQSLTLSRSGLEHILEVTNLSDKPMPAGLGLHPYFPRDEDAVYHGRHQGEWRTGDDGLPIELIKAEQAVDWWNGQPVAARTVDTAYCGREGPLTVEWPTRGVGLTISPSPALSHTVVYVPAELDFFCVEPVSHRTDAINDPNHDGVVVLWPGRTFCVSVVYAAYSLEPAP